ncbi:MAG TPA: SGNH/GDSL hydrolase family protein [Sphingomicrobium sp.]|jgi:phospholipase/lecithinase/hemolysin|nr:SGNH/GDSL hydrolase family protein [Sphingomicrobium sp.]
MAYTAVYVFGDSLVDSGNALKLAEWYDGLPLTDMPDGAPTQEDGYFKGRFSNGYTFADLVANKAVGLVTTPVFPYHFEDPWLGLPIAPFASDPTGRSLNFAYGGAHIRQGDEVVPDLDEQTDAFRDAVDGHAPAGALYVVTTGGNDVRDLAPTGSDPVSQAEAFAELQQCAQQLLHELGQIVDDGAHNLVITGIADVGLIPHYDRDGDGVLNETEQLRSDAATQYSIYLDTLIRTQVVPALRAMGANVTYVPLMDYVDANGNVVAGALSANLPTIAYLHGLTTAELSNNLLQYKDLVFFDHVHPNAQAHALLGAYMQSMIAGTPWIETLPLMGANIDYRATGAISAVGETDSCIVSLVAGTTYTFELLGTSSLGTVGSLGDPMMRLLGPGGNVIGSDDDSGAGFDATLTFTATTTGNCTVQLFAIGSLTGTYAFQCAVVGGAAMQFGNTYVVNDASVIVLEGAGGAGQDVVKASVGFTLSAGSEIEVLRTTNDQGKANINLTGNEFSQTIVGNSGANVLDGKEGADVLQGGAGADRLIGGSGNDRLTGGAGTDTFIFGVGSGQDHITDFTRKEVIAINGAAGVDSFSDLTIVNIGGNAVISWGTGDTVTLDGVRASSLSAADFSFSASAAFAESAGLQLAGGPDHHVAPDIWLPQLI